jgi:hypothetical protein
MSFIVMASMIFSCLSFVPAAYAQDAAPGTDTPEAIQAPSSTPEPVENSTLSPEATATEPSVTSEPTETPGAAPAEPSPTDTTTQTEVPTEIPPTLESPTELPPTITESPTETTSPTPTETPTPAATQPDELSASSGVPNDNRANVTTIGTLPYTQSIGTVGATVESDEPVSTCGSSSDGASVWYKYTPTVTGIYVVDSLSSNYNTVLAVYKSDLSQVNCNNDDPGQWGVTQSKLVFTAVKGFSYYLQITQRNATAGGNLILHVKKISCPSTSLCMTVADEQPAGSDYAEAIVYVPNAWSYMGWGDEYGYIEVKNIYPGKYRVVASGYSFLIEKDSVSAPGLFDTNAVGLSAVDLTTENINGSRINGDIAFTDSYGATGFIGYTDVSEPLRAYITPGTYAVSAVGWEDNYFIAQTDRNINANSENTINLDASKMTHETLTFHWDGIDEGSFRTDYANALYWGFVFDLYDGDVVTIATSPDIESPLNAYAVSYDDDYIAWNYTFFSGYFKAEVNGRNTDMNYGGNPFTISMEAESSPYTRNDTGRLQQYSQDSYGNEVTYIYTDDSDVYSPGSASITQAPGGDPSQMPKMLMHKPAKPQSHTRSQGDISQASYQDIYPNYTVHNSLGSLVSGYYPSWHYFQMPYYFKTSSTAPAGTWHGNVSINFGPHGGIQTGGIDFQVIAPTQGDSRANAVVANILPFDASFSSLGASLESGEPRSTCGWNNDSTSWFKFAPSVTGTYEVDTLGTDYDTVLTVFKTSSGGQINCNDNDNGQSDVDQSKLKFTAIKGTTYYIQVANRDSGNGGNIKFHLEQIPCPSGIFCVTVTDHNNQAAWGPYVAVLNGQGWWVEGNGGDEYGYAEVGSIPTGVYTISASAWETLVIKKGIAGPGAFGMTASGLPGVTLSARDKDGQPMHMTDIDIVPDFPTGMYSWVGQTYDDYSRTLYITPGKYGVTMINRDDRYILGSKVTFTTAARQSVILDASKLALDKLTIHLEGIDNSNAYFYPGIAFSSADSSAPTNDCCGRTIPISDEDSIFIGLPKGTNLPIRTIIERQDGSGNTWRYGLKKMNSFIAGSGPTDFTFGGSLGMVVESRYGEYSPGETGGWLGKNISDEHNNYLFSEIKQDSGSQDWIDISPQMALTTNDPDHPNILGSNSDGSFGRIYYFDIPDDQQIGSLLHGEVTLDSGPWTGQAQVSASKDMLVSVKTTVAANDDFNFAQNISTNPFNPAVLDTYGSTSAKDDPKMTQCGADAGMNTVWYKYVSTFDGILHLDTVGSDYDTILAVWTGKRGALKAVACSDDRSIVPHDQASELNTPVTKGTTFYIEVASYGSPAGAAGMGAQGKISDITAQAAGGKLSFHASTTACYKLSTNITPAGSGAIAVGLASNCWNKGYTAGSIVSLDANAKTNFAFTQWTGDANGTNAHLDLTMNKDEIVTANFRETIPPYVAAITTIAATADNKLTTGERTNVAIKQLLVTFSEPMASTAITNANSVTNPANYSLINLGPDGVLGTVDDFAIPVNTAIYTASTKRVVVSINGGGALVTGNYVFTIRHLIEDLHLNQLDGNHNGAGGDDYSVAFTIDISPSAPLLTSPPNKQILNNTTPTFTWQASAQAVKYHIQVSTVSNLTTNLVDLTLPEGVITYTPTVPLPEHLYYWRIAGINLFNHQGSWSSVRSFTVDVTPPSAPKLLNPLDSSSKVGTPAFSWSAVTGATLYQLQITVNFNPSDDFTSPVYASAWTGAMTLTPPWLEKGTYHWRVCARDAAGNPVTVNDLPNGSCSASRILTITPLTPLAPVPVSPVSGSTVTSSTPTLSWKAVAYGNIYRVQISSTSTFTNIIQDTAQTILPEVITYQASSLLPGKYYWHVMAYNIDGTGGQWSVVWSFIVP